MAGVPRSQLLLAHTFSTAGYSGAFTSPVGYVTLVKSFHVQGNSTTVSNVHLYAQHPGVPITVEMTRLELAINQTSQWEGWFVLNPDDVVVAYSDQAEVSVWLSGAILAGPNQFPPAATAITAADPPPGFVIIR